MTEEKKDFHAVISVLLHERLKPLMPQADGTKKDLNLLTCVEIYTTIFDALVEVISESQIKIDNEALNYLAQQYYDGILINGTQELDPEIFTQRAKVDNIPTQELALLAVMLKGTDFALPIIEEIQKRQ